MEAKRLFDFLEMQLYKQPGNIMVSGKQHTGKEWKHYSFMEVQRLANRVSTLLLNLGLKKGDNIAIVSANRPEWNFVDLGAMQIGVVVVPVYPTISEKDYQYIFNDAEIRYAFAGDETVYAILKKVSGEVPTLRAIFTFDPIPGADNFWEALPVHMDIHELQEKKDEVTEDDLVTIIYTSGTTGEPKGVMLTHKNMVSNINSVREVTPLQEGETAVSFLPLCHSFERMTFFAYLSYGFHIYYPEKIEDIAATLVEVKPFCFTTVPRMLEKVLESIMKKADGLTGFSKKIFLWAMKTAAQYRVGETNSMWYHVKLRIARKLVFTKWLDALGGNIRFIITGAAAVQPRLITLFTAADIHVIEGYGLTETSPVLCSNRLAEEERCIGTVGLPVPGVKIQLAEDGEILAKGPNIMKGYYKLPGLTAEVIDENGWFHTGDIGAWKDHHGKNFLQITDRKKELFKTAGGKYIAPQVIENKMKESQFIDQVMVVGGDDKKFISALIVPYFPALYDYAGRHHLSFKNKEDLLELPEIITLFKKEVENYNSDFGKWEKIKKFHLLANEWTQGTGELTPTLKLKRKVILEKYKNDVTNIYTPKEHLPGVNQFLNEPMLHS